VSAFWREGPDGVRVSVKVQPKSRRPGIQGRAGGTEGERLRIAVSEPAEDGRANRAVCATLAAALHVPAGRVSVAQGAGSREKTLWVEGDPQTLAAELDRL
jgi:uncharacterized protein (TIGR00251 family)